MALIDSLGWFFLAVLSAVGFGVSAFFMKLATVVSPEGRPWILLGLSISATIIFTGFGLISGTLSFPPALIALGIVMGLGTLLGNSCWVNAVKVGPASLTQPLANTNVVLVILMSIIFFDETLNTTEVVGVVILMVSVSLIGVDPDESISIKDRSWYLLIVGVILLLFFRVGGLKIADEFNLNSTSALALTYATGIVWFGAAIRRDLFSGERPPKAVNGFMLASVAAIFSFIGLQSYAFALVDGPASIVTPIFTANGVVLAGLTFTLLGERLSRLQWIALVGIIAGLIVLRL